MTAKPTGEKNCSLIKELNRKKKWRRLLKLKENQAMFLSYFFFFHATEIVERYLFGIQMFFFFLRKPLKRHRK